MTIMPTKKRRIGMLESAMCIMLIFGATHAAQASTCGIDDDGCLDDLHPRGLSTGPGTNVTVVNIDSFKSVASEVVVPGSTDADFCVAPDPREIDLSPTRHSYVPRQLALRELAGKGSCTGPIPTDSAGRTTWEQLLAQIDLRIDPWYRTFQGEFEGVAGYWVVVGVVRSTAQFRGPVVSQPVPEQLVDYSGFYALNDDNQLPCDTPLEQRPMTLSGTVPAFGEPANITGNRMIVDTAQCEGPYASITRRSTHVYAMRLDGRYLDEMINVVTQLSGLTRTINQAGRCVNSASQSAIAEMRRRVGTAATSILRRQWDAAVA